MRRCRRKLAAVPKVPSSVRKIEHFKTCVAMSRTRAAEPWTSAAEPWTGAAEPWTSRTSSASSGSKPHTTQSFHAQRRSLDCLWWRRDRVRRRRTTKQKGLAEKDTQTTQRKSRRRGHSGVADAHLFWNWECRISDPKMMKGAKIKISHKNSNKSEQQVFVGI